MPFHQSTERSLSSPSPKTLSQTVHRRYFCCGSSLLHVVMSVCMFGAVYFKYFDFDLLFISAMVTESPLFRKELLTQLIICNSVVC